MRIYTAHAREGANPRLVREGFSWMGLILGPLFLLMSGAWITAAIAMALGLAIGLAGAASGVGEVALALLIGLSAGDFIRWELGLRGWRMVEIVAAADEDAAFARLLDARPELASL